jgi:hypothetical protein
VQSLDLPDEHPTPNDIMVELIAVGDGRKLRTRNVAERVEVQTVNAHDRTVDNNSHSENHK